jgi:pilus assembly protein CpaD
MRGDRPKGQDMTDRFKTFSALLAAGLVLSATAADARLSSKYEPNRSLDSLNQPIVQRTDYVLDLQSGDNGLSTSERARLRAWFASLALGYGDRIWVDEPYGASRGGNDVARVAAEYGLLVGEGAPVTEGEPQPGTVRVIVSRSVASVPGCPNYDHAGPSGTSANYGCAVNSNWAAMVADPSDLVLGQAGSGTADANASNKAIKVYRETAPTGTKGLMENGTTRRGN